MAKFFGECNLINCKVIDTKNNNIIVDSEYGKFSISKDANFSPGDSIIFGIRPEEIKILDETSTNSLTLTIKDIEFKGSTSNINVKSNSTDNFLKIQNISSSISQSFQKNNSINVELNTAVGTIFKNERST